MHVSNHYHYANIRSWLIMIGSRWHGANSRVRCHHCRRRGKKRMYLKECQSNLKWWIERIRKCKGNIEFVHVRKRKNILLIAPHRSDALIFLHYLSIQWTSAKYNNLWVFPSTCCENVHKNTFNEKRKNAYCKFHNNIITPFFFLKMLHYIIFNITSEMFSMPVL